MPADAASPRYTTQPIQLDGGQGAAPPEDIRADQITGPITFGAPSPQPTPEPPPQPVDPGAQSFASQVGEALHQRGAGPSYKEPTRLPEVTVQGDAPQTGQQAQGIGAGIAPTYVRAHWDESRIPFRPEDIRAVRAAGLQQAQGQKQQLDLEADGLRRQKAMLDFHADQLEDMNREHAVAEQKRQNRYADLRKRAEQLSTQAADAKVQPGKLFADQGAGFAIMAAIGGALGGMLQARIGGENQFMRTLDTMIDRDIRAQQANIEQGWKQADAAREDYGALRTQLGDERLAEEVHRARINNWVATRIKSIIANTDSQVVKQRGNELLDDFKLRDAEMRMRIGQAAYVPAMTVGGGAGPQVEQGRVVRLPDGTVKIAPDATTGNDLNKRIALQQELANNDREALKLRDEFWGASLERKNEIRLKLNALQDSSMSIISIGHEQGVVRDPDAARMKSGRVNYTTMTPGGSKALQEMMQFDNKQIHTHVNQRAAELGSAGYALDARGNVVPRTTFQGAATKPASGKTPSGFKAVK